MNSDRADALSVDDRIDAICDAFEAAWQTGKRPDLSDYLGSISLTEQAELASELVALDIEYRERLGEGWNLAEYQSRFPEFQTALAALEHSLGSRACAQLSTRRPSATPQEPTNDEGLPPLAVGTRLIGRYRIERLVGVGAFAHVYLAEDEELRRSVAIKLPRRPRTSNPHDVAAELVEARHLAGLDHPQIVPVYDVGRTDDGRVFVVSKFIAGQSLKERLQTSRPSFAEAAEILAAVALALHHAHEKHLVHRDIKPANLLLESATQIPFVTDFGLATRGAIAGPEGRITGTPAYMSPEQARGETHRLDRRSDLFSLGIVLYELLTGMRPFRGATDNEVLHQIVSLEPRPPRALESAVPAELERICMKALSKRAADRYATALELAEDLRLWPSVEAARSRSARMEPKGLRTFEATDAEAFLDLVPGPRDRTGLPDSICFWKTRLEATEPNLAFPVGLLLGPSGCGKSSFVKAGLLPRLDDQITVVYLETSADDTEQRLVRGLRRKRPELSRRVTLETALATIRRRGGAKTVLILDQFEQWLHANEPALSETLIRALRHCDGTTLQALLLVRDDFSLAAARFMDVLEVPIRQGQNFAFVDYFDETHAARALTRFGQAFDRLPLSEHQFSESQRQLVTRVVAGLAEDGKVLPVRLSLLAEMIKDKPWEAATLEALGGLDGIGIKFLDDAFTPRSAPPDHRLHAEAARAVLQALLPPVGTNIRGHLKSHAELVAASGYEDRPAEFNQLVRILDGELRLLTPTDLPGSRSGSSSEVLAQYYQLTHDYLVPLLRDWLTRGQQATRRGRAELRLAERAALWVLRPERRLLPSFLEYLSFTLWTSPAKRTATQRDMLSAARRHYARQAAIVGSLTLVLAATALIAVQKFRAAQNASRANAVVDQLLVADIGQLPALAAKVDRQQSGPLLVTLATDPSRTSAERLRANFALADTPGPHAEALVSYSRAADLPSLQLIRARIAPYAPALAQKLWSAVQDDETPPSARLRLAALLVTADEHSATWPSVADRVVAALLAENSLDLDTWAELLQPVAEALLPHLTARFLAPTTTSAERVALANLLARYAGPEELVELVLAADAATFSTLLAGCEPVEPIVARALEARLKASPEDSVGTDALTLATRHRNALMALVRLKRPATVEPLLQAVADPTVRTLWVLDAHEFGVTTKTILATLPQFHDPAARQALLLAIAADDLSVSESEELVFQLTELLTTSKWQAERSAAAWLLRELGRDTLLEEITDKLSATHVEPAPLDRDWWITKDGQTMVILPEDSRAAKSDELQAAALHRVAIGAYEVTMQDYRAFQADAAFATDVSDNTPDAPANRIGYLDAIRYCRWFSEQAGISEDQMCYPPLAELTEAPPTLSAERLKLTGYRLPTEAEWQMACQAGSSTPWFTGTSDEHLLAFGWFSRNAANRQRRLGSLRPNPLGLFDIVGNVAEWCHVADDDEKKYALRGGAFRNEADLLRSAERYLQSPTAYSYTGFRLARTLPAVP